MAAKFKIEINQRVDMECHPYEIVISATGLPGTFTELEACIPVDADAKGAINIPDLERAISEIASAVSRVLQAG